MEIVLTFHTTHGVVSAERTLLAAGFRVEASGIPPAISAGCGLCLRLAERDLEQALCRLETQGIPTQGVYRQEAAGYHRIEEKGEADPC